MDGAEITATPLNAKNADAPIAAMRATGLFGERCFAIETLMNWGYLSLSNIGQMVLKINNLMCWVDCRKAINIRYR
jgi:hypothetical protein